MSKIMVKPSDLRGQAAELERQRRQQQEIMKQLRILVMSLSESWKGEAQEAFQAKFLSHNRLMIELSNTLERYIELVQKAANDAEEADNELLRMVKRIE